MIVLRLLALFSLLATLSFAALTEDGPFIDPNGRSAGTIDGGGAMDPNGQGSGIDPNGYTGCVDPNG